MSHRRVAAIDMGSNAIRMMIAQRQPHGFRILKKMRAPVRLGHDVFLTGAISKEAFHAVDEAFAAFTEAFHEEHLDDIKIVATSACREARNNHELVQYIQMRYGLEIEIIDGTEEGQLIHLAVQKALDLEKKDSVLIDIGGGSVEITFSQGPAIYATKSFPIGTVRLLESIKKRNLSERDIPILIGELLGPIEDHIRHNIRKLNLKFAIGTGGNLECLGHLRKDLLGEINSTHLSFLELKKIINMLYTKSYSQRVKELGLKPDRADVIIPAALVVDLIMRQCEVDRIYIPQVGLRDGIIWSLFEQQARTDVI